MIKSKNDLHEYLEQDRKALSIKPLNLASRVKEFFFPNYIWQYERTLRMTEYYTNVHGGLLHKILYLYYRAKFRKLSLRMGFSIPVNVCGPGLSIAHYGTIVISQNSKIGANCHIHACVNIGASAGEPEGPTIGDNVYIGPGALLFGNITIADNVTIAANATVNKSCDIPNCVLAGVPAKAVKESYPNWLEFNKVQM